MAENLCPERDPASSTEPEGEGTGGVGDGQGRGQARTASYFDRRGGAQERGRGLLNLHLRGDNRLGGEPPPLLDVAGTQGPRGEEL
eukprot:2226423-Pyramimonas_sp.AAC.1